MSEPVMQMGGGQERRISQVMCPVASRSLESQCLGPHCPAWVPVEKRPSLDIEFFRAVDELTGGDKTKRAEVYDKLYETLRQAMPDHGRCGLGASNVLSGGR